MKRFSAAVLSAVIIIYSAVLSVAADEPEKIASEAVCLMDALTGQVLYEKDMHKVLEPASITKVMTVALVLEKGFSSDSVVTMTDEAVWSVGRDTTHIALTPGETVPVKDLLYGTLLQSANDCANGLALYVDGDIAKFAKRMTDKAHELGAYDTNFVNPNGLPDPQHVTTAYDMALITRWAVSVPGFKEIFKTIDYKMKPTNMQPKEREFHHGHKSINPSSEFYYEYATGGKTGWTEEAKNTAVTLAEKDGTELISVTMMAEEAKDRYSDIKILFDYGFENFNRAEFSKERFSQAPVPIYDNDQKVGQVVIKPKDIVITKPATAAKADIDIQLNFPIRYNINDEIKPMAQFILDDAVIASIPFEFEKNVDASQVSARSLNEEEGKKGFKDFYISPYLCFTFAFFALAVLLLFGIRSINIIRYNQRMAKRALKKKSSPAVSGAPKRTPGSDDDFFNTYKRK